MKFSNEVNSRFAGKHKANIAMTNFSKKKIIDIGCGCGIFEKYVSKRAKKITAIEPNGNDIAVAKQEIKAKNVEFLQIDILKYKTKEKFDIALLFDVIEHVPKKKEIQILQKINELLKDKGLLLISTPKNNFSKFFDLAWYFGHRHYSSDKISDFLTSAGFNINRIYTLGGFYEVFAMNILFYVYKWLFNSEIPFKKWFDKKRDEEYILGKKGFVSLFIIASKK